MNHRREFSIPFVGLKPGVHEYNYIIEDKFFDDFQSQDFTNCNAQIKLLLDKKSSFMILKFEVGGSLQVVCDRCNSQLPLELWDDFTMTIKMVENPEEMNEQEDDPDMYYIAQGESHIDVAGWIYEFINLSIPMQKTCNYENMKGPHCNQSSLDMLKKRNTDEKKVIKENPIWKGLEKFKDLD